MAIEHWFANPRSEAVREVQELFPNGNQEDYWLGCAAYDNTMGQPGWVSANGIVREMRQNEIDGWSPDEDAIISLIRHDTERGGGMVGASPELAQVRAAMQVSGERALDFERRLYARQRDSSRL